VEPVVDLLLQLVLDPQAVLLDRFQRGRDLREQAGFDRVANGKDG
jgi:hypothetical protein